MSNDILLKNKKYIKYLSYILIIISVFIFQDKVKAYVGCRGNECMGYSGVRCYPGQVQKDLGAGTFCELEITNVDYGGYIYNGGIGTYPKYIYDKVGFCVQHHNAAPIPGSQCYLKYYDGFSKPALAGLGRILVNAGASSQNGEASMTRKNFNSNKYVNIQSAQNDLLKRLEVPGYRYNSIVGRGSDYLKDGLDDAFDYYYYTAENNSFVSLRTELMDKAAAKVADSTNPYIIHIVLPEYTYKGIRKSVSYNGYTVSFTTKSGKKYKSTCGATCTNDSNKVKSDIFSCFKSASGDYCRLNITEDLKKDLTDGKVTLTINMWKYFYIAKLYDCGGGYQDLTLGDTHPETKSIKRQTTIKSGSVIKEDTCQDDFEKINDYNNLTTRAELYRKYENKYNNLFNLNYGKGDGELACSAKDCSKENAEGSCLSYSKINQDQDFSCYSDISYEQNGTFNYICKTDFDLENNLDTTNFNVASGAKIPGTDGVIATATLRKLCSASRDVSINLDFDIINDIKFGDVSLKQVVKKASEEDRYNGEETTNLKFKDDLSKGNKIYNYLYEFYAPNSVLLEKGTGKKIDEEEYNKLTSEEKLKYNVFTTKKGIYSSYKSGEKQYIPFSISFKPNNNSAGNEKNSRYYLADYSTESEPNESKKCTYQIEEELLKDGLNLEFREIDTKKPFKDKNGNTRNTMTNWCYDGSKFDENVYSNLQDKSVISAASIQKYYVNKNDIAANDIYSDGVINNIDAAALQAKSVDAASEVSCKSNNVVVKGAIKNRPNSYGLDNNNEKYDPKYKITLTPQIMKDISDYAKKNDLTYDSFDLECRDNNSKLCVDATEIKDRMYQTSKLVSYLKDSNKLTINYSTKRKLD